MEPKRTPYRGRAFTGVERLKYKSCSGLYKQSFPSKGHGFHEQEFLRMFIEVIFGCGDTIAGDPGILVCKNASSGAITTCITISSFSLRETKTDPQKCGSQRKRCSAFLQNGDEQLHYLCFNTVVGNDLAAARRRSVRNLLSRAVDFWWFMSYNKFLLPNVSYVLEGRFTK